MLTVSRSDFEHETIPDSNADASYLEQEGFEERLQEYRDGSFGFVGVRAAVTIAIPFGAAAIEQRITSPGLWGIEDDSGADYMRETFAEECNTLAYMLAEMGITVED